MSRRENHYAFLVRPWSRGTKTYYIKKFGPAFWKETKMPLKPFEDLYENKDPTLYGGIQDAIVNSSFVVVDVTLGLPNIYWEYGYALAIGKPVLLVKRKQKEEVPIQTFIGSIVSSKKDGDKNKNLLKNIVERHYGIPSDTQSVVYNNAPKVFTESQKKKLKRIINQTFLQAYNRPQRSLITRSLSE